jgi:hypothetical protein
MTGSEPARAGERRARSILLTAPAVLGVALVGVRICRSLASSSSPAALQTIPGAIGRG